MRKKKRGRKSTGMTSSLTGKVTFGGRGSKKTKVSKSRASGTITFGTRKKM